MKSSMSWSLPFLCAALAWGCQTNSAPQRKRVAVPKSTTAQQTEDIGKSSSSESIAEGLKSAVSRYSDQTGKEIKTPDVATLIKAIDKAAPQAAANAMVDQAGVTKAPGDKTLTGGTMWSYLLAEISQPGLLIPIGLGVAGLGASAFVPALRAYLKNVYVADQASKPAEGNGLRAEETRVAGASGGGEAPIGQVQPGAASAAAPVVAGQERRVPTDEDFADLKVQMDQLELKYNASNEILGRVLGFKAELESRRELKVRSPPYGAPAHQVGADRGAMEVGQGTRAGLVPVGAIPRGPPADAQWGRPVDSAEYASRQPAKAMDPAAREAVVRERIQFLEAEMEQLVQAHGKLREQWEDRFKQLSPAFAEQQAQRARQLVAQSPRPEPLSSSDLQRSHPVGELPRKVQFKPDVTLAKEHSPFPGKLIAAGAVTAIGVAILGAGLNQAVKQSLLLTDAHTPEEQLQESFRELEWQWMLLKGQEAAEKDMQK